METLEQIRKAWVESHPSVKGWLERLAPITRKNAERYAYRYFNWIQQQEGPYKGKSPEELLDIQDKTIGREQYIQLELLQRWTSQQRLRTGTKRALYSTIRSFYAHNKVSLPRDATFKVRGDVEPVQRLLSVEELKQIILSCNTTFRAVFLCMFQGAMGCHEWEYFNTKSWDQVKPQLEAGKQRIKVTFPGRKHAQNEKPYYTFIGRDGVDALRKYLRERRTRIHDGEAIVLNDRGEPVTSGALRRYFHNHAVRVGALQSKTPKCPSCGGETVKVRRWTTQKKWTGPFYIYYKCKRCEVETPASELPQPKDIRYKISPHEMRDLFRSEWELSPSKVVCAEFFMGHDIDPNMYNKIMKLHPDWAESQYALAEPYLNILSEDPRRVPVDHIKEFEETIKTLKTEKDELLGRIEKLEGHFKSWLGVVEVLSQYSPQEIKALFDLVRSKEQEKLEQDIQEGETAVRERWAKEHKTEQRVIDGNELQKHLEEGWRYVNSLNNGSGKVIVEKEASN